MSRLQLTTHDWLDAPAEFTDSISSNNTFDPHEKLADYYHSEQEQSKPLISPDTQTSRWFHWCVNSTPVLEQERKSHEEPPPMEAEDPCTEGKRRKKDERMDYDGNVLKLTKEGLDILAVADAAGPTVLVKIAASTLAVPYFRLQKSKESDCFWRILQHPKLRIKFTTKRRLLKKKYFMANFERWQAKDSKRRDFKGETEETAIVCFLVSVYRAWRRFWTHHFGNRKSSRISKRTRNYKRAKPPASSSIAPSGCNSPDLSEDTQSTGPNVTDACITPSPKNGPSPRIAQTISSPAGFEQQDVLCPTRCKSVASYTPPRGKGHTLGKYLALCAEARRSSDTENALRKSDDNVVVKPHSAAVTSESWRRPGARSGSTEPTTIENWRAAAKEQTSMGLEKCRPGFIAWLPRFEYISEHSILHNHEDFGIDPDSGKPRGAYGHPALVYEEDGDDVKRYICLKITSWTDRGDRPKWVGTAGAQERRALYIPLTGTNPTLKEEAEEMQMPILTFEDGKNMPPKEDGKLNLSRVNVERVFSVEKLELKDFVLNGKQHSLYLTKQSLAEIRHYRDLKDRKSQNDKETLDRQRRGYEQTVTSCRRMDPVVCRSSASLNWRARI